MLLCSQAAYGQADVTFSDVKSVITVVKSVTTTTQLVDEGGDSIGEAKPDTVSTDPVVTKEDAGKLLTVVTEAANVQLRVSDAKRDPVDFKELGNNRFLLAAPGKQWVDLQVIDFQKNIFFTRQYVVDVKTPVGPDPPPIPPDPTPDIPDDRFDNIGQRVAQWSAGLLDKDKVSAIYLAHAGMLRSDPSKTINDVSGSLQRSLSSIPQDGLIDFRKSVNADLTQRWVRDELGRVDLADYYTAISVGLGGAK